jgi:transposase
MEGLIAMNDLFPQLSKIDGVSVDNGLVVDYNPNKKIAQLYLRGRLIKRADFNDKVEKKLFIIDAVKHGCNQSKLAKALDISRQTINNYINTKEEFGLEGLVHGYNPAQTKDKRKQRQLHRDKRNTGNTARKLEEIRKQRKHEAQQNQLNVFDIPEDEIKKVDSKDQPYIENHDWQFSRYAGVFCYIITLISNWKWLDLIQGYFGIDYKIFLVFVFMSAKNILSIEQLKNIRKREAGLILGLIRIPGRSKLWEDFYKVARQKLSLRLLTSYFLYQLRTGFVSLWCWFTDGHLLPYEGKEKVHHAFKTQSQRPHPGQTNNVTCDSDGRIVDFGIEEGKGNLFERIKFVCKKWKSVIPFIPVQVFDREIYGAQRFKEFIDEKIPFVCWDKNVDTTALKKLSDNLFVESLTFNDVEYKYFESEKTLSYAPDQAQPKEKIAVPLRHFTIWNMKSKRRTGGLASPKSLRDIPQPDCVKGILMRWGASENTFKHIKTRHPFHYHPGFKMVDSDNQQIVNPELKELDKQIKNESKKLNKLCKELSKAEASQCGRKNSMFDRIKAEISVSENILSQLKAQKSPLPEKIDVRNLENYRSFKKIDNEGKNLFDFATSSVWNARKQMVSWLRNCYDRENETVDLFYAITHCHGWIKVQPDQVIVRLEPLEQEKRRAAQEYLCRKLTHLYAKIKNGKRLVIDVGESPIKEITT